MKRVNGRVSQHEVTLERCYIKLRRNGITQGERQGPTQLRKKGDVLCWK